MTSPWSWNLTLGKWSEQDFLVGDQPGVELHPPSLALCHGSRGKGQILCASRIQTDGSEVIPFYPALSSEVSLSPWSCEKSGSFSFCPLSDLFS